MKKRILYVDDNPNNRDLIRRILHAEGHEMLEAVDGESGWHAVNRETPDFIFMDILMPGIDGFELTRKIKSNPELSHIPVITLTAYGNPETEKIARDAGCDAFLHKPVGIKEIKTVLHQFLGAVVAPVV
jgi:two-component system cell cycle response regulator DivK